MRQFHFIIIIMLFLANNVHAISIDNINILPGKITSGENFLVCAVPSVSDCATEFDMSFSYGSQGGNFVKIGDYFSNYSGIISSSFYCGDATANKSISLLALDIRCNNSEGIQIYDVRQRTLDVGEAKAVFFDEAGKNNFEYGAYPNQSIQISAYLEHINGTGLSGSIEYSAFSLNNTEIQAKKAMPLSQGKHEDNYTMEVPLGIIAFEAVSGDDVGGRFVLYKSIPFSASVEVNGTLFNLGDSVEISASIQTYYSSSNISAKMAYPDNTEENITLDSTNNHTVYFNIPNNASYEGTYTLEMDVLHSSGYKKTYIKSFEARNPAKLVISPVALNIAVNSSAQLKEQISITNNAGVPLNKSGMNVTYSGELSELVSFDLDDFSSVLDAGGESSFYFIFTPSESMTSDFYEGNIMIDAFNETFNVPVIITNNLGPAIVISRENLTGTVTLSENHTETITLTNNGSVTALNITIDRSSFAGYLTVDETGFDLLPNESRSIDFIFSFDSLGNKTGEIFINGSNFASRKIHFEFMVEEKVVCGDGKVTGEETCDTYGDIGCSNYEECVYCSKCEALCGDGVVYGGEVCDRTDGCPQGEACNEYCSACETVFCGDGKVTGEETCDVQNNEGCDYGLECRDCSSCNEPSKTGWKGILIIGAVLAILFVLAMSVVPE